MTRFVLDAPVVVQLALDDREVLARHTLLAPTLMRSEVLALVYASVRAGQRDERAARRLLDDIRALRIRLLGDRSLQSKAWSIARALDWSSTLDAEYVALTTLQADAFVTCRDELRAAAATIVDVARPEDLFREPS